VNTYLVVAAHPDDEVLGLGGTIYKLTQAGNRVDVLIMSANAKARTRRPSTEELFTDLEMSSRILGVTNVITGDFPNIEFNNIPHIKLVQFIEAAIIDVNPNVIVTHWPGDTNNDHMHTALACQAAIRLFQRRNDVKPLDACYFMEVPSSTEWTINTATNTFTPNTFVEIGNDGLDIKLKALETYRGVMRDFPHPRSLEVLRGLAAYRGGQAGLIYAEAFACAFRRVKV
jgi:LmbE family N-acetylglucosaminyl deacetylase